MFTYSFIPPRTNSFYSTRPPTFDILKSNFNCNDYSIETPQPTQVCVVVCDDLISMRSRKPAGFASLAMHTHRCGIYYSACGHYCGFFFLNIIMIRMRAMEFTICRQTKPTITMTPHPTPEPNREPFNTNITQLHGMALRLGCDVASALNICPIYFNNGVYLWALCVSRNIHTQKIRTKYN